MGDYYIGEKEYEKAEGLITEALESWRKIDKHKEQA